MHIRTLLFLALAVLASALAPAALAQQLLYVHADHLNTPRLVTNGSGAPVWRWDQTEPFGDNPPNEDPDGNGTPGHMPLRFPGQYYDKETNLAYNYYRDYDPAIGRYIQSDPIGLRGGLNLYSYVASNPISRTDPLGLEWLRPYGYPNEPYVVGRDGTLVPPGGAIGKIIEHCVPAGRTFGQLHDAKVDTLRAQGVPDWRANVPTMPATYWEAVKQEATGSVESLERSILELLGVPGGGRR